MSNMEVAKTILKQLGGNKFIAMTGAKDFVSGDKSLSFKLPNSRVGINKVIITLTELDIYKMEFGRLNSLLEYKIVTKEVHVYFHQLQQIFTEKTGLNCSL